MSRVVGWDEDAFAAAVDKRPVLSGLAVVMVGAEPIEQLEDRGLCSRPVFAVVRLKKRHAVTPFDGTGGIQPLEGALLVGVGTPAQVRHPHHVLALGHDGSQERVLGVEKVPDR